MPAQNLIKKISYPSLQRTSKVVIGFERRFQLAPCYDFLSHLTNSQLDVTPLEEIAKNATLRLMYYRRAKATEMIALATGGKQASGLPPEKKFVSLQLAMIIALFLDSNYEGTTSLEAFESDLVTSSGSFSLAAAYQNIKNLDNLRKAVEVFINDLDQLLVEVDKNLFDHAEAVVTTFIETSQLKDGYKGLFRQIDQLVAVLRTTVLVVSANFSSRRLLTEVVPCRTVELPTEITNANATELTLSLFDIEFGLLIEQKERSIKIPDLKEVITVDKNRGNAVLKDGFLLSYISSLSENYFNDFAALAADFRKICSAMPYIKEYCDAKALLSCVDEKYSLTQTDRILLRLFGSSQPSKEVVTFEIMPDVARATVDRLYEKYNNEFQRIVEVLCKYYKTQTILEHYKAIAGYSERKPVVCTVVDTTVPTASKRLFEVAANIGKKIFYSSKMLPSDVIPEYQLAWGPFSDGADATIGSVDNALLAQLFNDSVAAKLFGLKSFYKNIPQMFINGGTKISKCPCGLNFVGDVESLRREIMNLCRYYQLDYNEATGAGVISLQTNGHQVLPGNQGAPELCYGDGHKPVLCAASVDFKDVGAVDIQKADAACLLTTFPVMLTAGAKSETLRKLYYDRLRRLCDAKSVECIEGNPIIPQAVEKALSGANEASNTLIPQSVALWSFYGKLQQKATSLTPQKIIYVLNKTMLDDAFDNVLPVLSHSIKREYSFSFELPLAMLPAVNLKFAEGQKQIAGVTNTLGHESFSIIKNGDQAVITYRVDPKFNVSWSSQLYGAQDEKYVKLAYDIPVINQLAEKRHFICGQVDCCNKPEQVIRHAAFFDPSADRVTNIARWTHAAVLAACLHLSDRTSAFYAKNPFCKDSLISNLSFVGTFLEENFAPTTVLSVDYFSATTCGKLVAAIKEAVTQYDFQSMHNLFGLMDAADYGMSTGPIAFAPIPITKYDTDWMKEIASQVVSFIRMPKAILDVSYGSEDDSALGADIAQLLREQIVNALNMNLITGE